MAKKSAPVLSTEQLSDVLGLIKAADSVELKLTVPDTDHVSAVAALGMDVLESEIRQIMFFDTPDLALNNQAVIEVDAMPGGFVCSGSVKAKELDPLKVKEAFAGERPISKLFTSALDFFAGQLQCAAPQGS